MTGAVCGLEDYPWPDGNLGCAHEYLLPELARLLEDFGDEISGARALDLGCGNGAVAAWLALLSWPSR